MEMLTRMEKRMDWNAQAMKGDMQALNGDLQNQMDANKQLLKGDMQNMVRNFSNGIGTERGEMSESRGECGGCSDRDDDGQGQGDE